MADTERINIVVDATDNASNVLGNVRGSLMNIGRGINALNSGLRQYNSAMAGINRMMINVVKEAGAAIYDFTSDSIDNFTELSEQHAKTLGAMANNYDKTLESQQKFMENSEKLRQQAIDMSKYGVTINGVTSNGSLASPVEVSAAQTALAKAGVNDDAMLTTDVVSEIVQFAKANDLGTEESVSFAVALGNQFGYSYDQWGEMLDKVSHTADLAPIGVSDVVQSMKYAGGISSGLDRPMEETLAEIAVLGNFGLRGTQAGSGIQALLTRILTGDTTVITQAQADVAPPKALEAFYDFSNYAKSGGTEITYDDILNETFTESDITGQLRPMDDVLDALEQQMSELNDEEQAWFAKKLFGLYQMKSAYALINGDENESSLNDVIKEIQENSGGTNSNKLAELLNSQSGRIQSTRNLIEGIKTDLGQMLEPTVAAVLGEFQGFLKDPNNYQINWDNIRDALDESCNAIEETYGTAIANAVRNLGNLTIDLGQVVENVAPEFVDGMVNVLNAAISGDFFGEDGVGASWEEMIGDMHASLQDLPPELQQLGEKVVDVIDMFGKLATLNIATTIAQLVTSVLQIAMMTINAASVVVNGTGIMGGTSGTGTGGAVAGANASTGNTTNNTNTNGSTTAGTIAGTALNITNSWVGNIAGVGGAVGGAHVGGKVGGYLGDVGGDIAESLGASDGVSNTIDSILTSSGSIAGGIYGAKGAKWGLGKLAEQIALAKEVGLKTYASNAGMSLSQLITANPALVNWLGVYGPAIPDAIHNTGEMIHYATDKDYRNYSNWRDNVWGDRNNQSTLESMQSAINDGMYEQWVDKYISEFTNTNPDTGYFDNATMINTLMYAMNGSSGNIYKSADEVKNAFMSLNTEDISKIVNIDDLVSKRSQLEMEIQSIIGESGNYYNTWEDRRNSPFYGTEGMTSYKIGEYTDEDLETLRNTMVKDYVENGKIDVSSYFGNYTYQGGSYAKQVNKVLRDMFGEDTGYSSNFFSELFSDQYKTSNSLNTGIEKILSGSSYLDSYNNIINGANSANLTDKQNELDNLIDTQYQELITSLDSLNETISGMANDQQTPTINWAETIPGFYAMSDKGQQQAIQAYLNNDIAITPQFTMEAPQISVAVTVDESGKILSQKQSILNPAFNTTINNWYQKVASQNGGTTK